MNKPIPNEKIISEVTKWQARLKLNHWDIQVDILDQQDMPGRMGQVECNFAYLRAYISLTNRDDNTFHTKRQMTDNIVHELMHIHMSGMNTINGTPEALAEEHAVCILTKAFCESYDWK